MHDKIMPILNETKWILYFHFGGLLVHYSGSHLDYFNIFYKKKKVKLAQKNPAKNNWREYCRINTLLFR